ncbi:MAG: hypothetical protein ABSF28_17785 [Terracidiphilus sp.]|jgi:hypothetical protein
MNGLIRQIAGAWLLTIVGSGLARASEPVIHHEPITVRVLDGRGGMPLARVHLMLIAGYDRHDLHQGLWQEEAITNGAGAAQVPDSLVSFPYLQVVVARHRMCIGNVSESRFSMDRIRFAGLNSPNRCGVLTVENLSGVFVIFAKAKGSDKRPVMGSALQAAATSPEAAARVASISTPSLAKLAVLAATSAPSAAPSSSPAMDASSSTSGPASVPLPLRGTPLPQSSDPVCGAIPTPATAATLQPESMLTAAGLLVDEESEKLPTARPEAADLSEWMCP